MHARINNSFSLLSSLKDIASAPKSLSTGAQPQTSVSGGVALSSTALLHCSPPLAPSAGLIHMVLIVWSLCMVVVVWVQRLNVPCVALMSTSDSYSGSMASGVTQNLNNLKVYRYKEKAFSYVGRGRGREEVDEERRKKRGKRRNDTVQTRVECVRVYVLCLYVLCLCDALVCVRVCVCTGLEY